MKKQNIKILNLFFLCIVVLTVCACISRGTIQANDTGISEEELNEFNVTLYTEKEKIPLDRLITLDNKPYDSGELNGKYSLVNFWASWCPYCRREMPSKQFLYSEIENEEFVLLTVSVGEDPETVTGYMNENGYDFPVVIDPDNELKKIYAPKIPTSYVIDPQGYIIARINGNKEWDSEHALRILNYLLNDIDLFM